MSEACVWPTTKQPCDGASKINKAMKQGLSSLVEKPKKPKFKSGVLLVTPTTCARSAARGRGRPLAAPPPLLVAAEPAASAPVRAVGSADPGPDDDIDPGPDDETEGEDADSESDDSPSSGIEDMWEW